MVGFLSTFAAVLPEWEAAVKACQSVPSLETCSVLRATQQGSDNAFCATMDFASDDKIAVFKNWCKLDRPCPRTVHLPALPSDAGILKRISADEWMTELSELPQQVREKIGNGARFNMMNIAVFKEWACQSFAQLTNINNMPLLPARAYAYDKESDECILLKKYPQAERVSSSVQRVQGIVGRRNCGCGIGGVACERVTVDPHDDSLPEDIVECAGEEFDWTKCQFIENLASSADPIFCAATFDPALCGKSANSAKCYESVEGVVLPSKKSSMGTSAADVREFLAAQGANFWDFAGKVGFTEPQGNYGLRQKLMAPARGGPVACRAVLTMVGANSGAPIKDVDMYLFDTETETCHFFRETDFDAAQNSDPAPFLVGPTHC